MDNTKVVINPQSIVKFNVVTVHGLLAISSDGTVRYLNEDFDAEIKCHEGEELFNVLINTLDPDYIADEEVNGVLEIDCNLDGKILSDSFILEELKPRLIDIIPMMMRLDGLVFPISLLFEDSTSGDIMRIDLYSDTTRFTLGGIFIGERLTDKWLISDVMISTVTHHNTFA